LRQLHQPKRITGKTDGKKIATSCFQCVAGCHRCDNFWPHFTIQKISPNLPNALDGYLLTIALGGIIGFLAGFWAFRLKQKQAKTQRLNLILMAIRDVGQLLVHEKDRVKLLNGSVKS
jgi:hypothetical protein